jgi:hypothetical protein
MGTCTSGWYVSDGTYSHNTYRGVRILADGVYRMVRVVTIRIGGHVYSQYVSDGTYRMGRIVTIRIGWYVQAAVHKRHKSVLYIEFNRQCYCIIHRNWIYHAVFYMMAKAGICKQVTLYYCTFRLYCCIWLCRVKGAEIRGYSNMGWWESWL